MLAMHPNGYPYNMNYPFNSGMPQPQGYASQRQPGQQYFLAPVGALGALDGAAQTHLQAHAAAPVPVPAQCPAQCFDFVEALNDEEIQEYMKLDTPQKVKLYCSFPSCPEKERRFFSYLELAEHMNVHSRESNFFPAIVCDGDHKFAAKCPFVVLGFLRESDKKEHKQQRQCDSCKKIFSRVDNLKTHRKGKDGKPSPCQKKSRKGDLSKSKSLQEIGMKTHILTTRARSSPQPCRKSPLRKDRKFPKDTRKLSPPRKESSTRPSSSAPSSYLSPSYSEIAHPQPQTAQQNLLGLPSNNYLHAAFSQPDILEEQNSNDFPLEHIAYDFLNENNEDFGFEQYSLYSNFQKNMFAPDLQNNFTQRIGQTPQQQYQIKQPHFSPPNTSQTLVNNGDYSNTEGSASVLECYTLDGFPDTKANGQLGQDFLNNSFQHPQQLSNVGSSLSEASEHTVVEAEASSPFQYSGVNNNFESRPRPFVFPAEAERRVYEVSSVDYKIGDPDWNHVFK